MKKNLNKLKTKVSTIKFKQQVNRFFLNLSISTQLEKNKKTHEKNKVFAC